MANSRDTRIVQMQFDNKDFEKNVKQSEKSLDRFKEHLDFSKCEKDLDNFERATKALTFDKLVENVQKLTDKFTGLGTVSEYVLSRIRSGIESAISKMGNFVDQFGFEQINAGLEKYGEMNKNVQTIMAATGRSENEVYGVLERLNRYTDMTSYNFTDMAANIGKFTSVGIPLETAERQMEGIANWAARSGAGIQETSRAMYNLSQAMGLGKLTSMDWKSIENAGMATKEFKEEMIEAGIAVGTLERDVKTGVVKTSKKFGKQVEVTYENFRDTLSKGWANKEVIGNTLEAYYYDDLSGAGLDVLVKLDDEQKKIFNDMFLNKKGLTKQDWKKLQSLGIITEDNKQKLLDLAVGMGKVTKTVKEDGSVMYTAIDKSGKKVEFTMDTIEESLSAEWFDKSLYEKATTVNELGRASYEAAQKCKTFTDVLVAWKDQLSTGWMKSWQLVFGNLTEAMEVFTAICNKVGDSFSDFIASLVGDGDKIPGILGAWSELGGRDSLWSLFIGEYDGMYEGAYGFLDVIKDVGHLITQGFWDMIYTVYSVMNDNPVTREEWDLNAAFRHQFIGGQIKEITERIRNFIASIRDFFDSVPEGSSKSRIQILRDIIGGISNAFLIAYTVIRDIINFFRGVANQLGDSFDAILGLLGSLGLGIQDTAKTAVRGGGLKVIFDQILEAIKPLTTAINGFIIRITEFIKKFIQAGKESGTFRKIWDGLAKVIGLVAKVISKVSGPIIDFFGNFIEAVGDLFSGGFSLDNVKTFGKKLAKALELLVNDIFNLFPGGGKIQEFISYIFGFKESDGDEESKTIIGTLKQWLRKIFGGVGDLVKSFKGEMGNVSLFSLIKEHLGLGLFAQFLTQLTGLVKGTNLYGIIMGFLGGYALIKLIKMLKQGGGLFTTIKGFFGTANDALRNGFKLKFGIADQVESFGDKMLKIAAAIALIAGAVVVLGSMNWKNLVKGFVALGAVMLAMFGFIMLLKKVAITSLKETAQLVTVLIAVGGAILGICAGLALLLLAMKPIANLSWEQMGKMGAALAGMLLMLGAFALVMSKVGKLKGVGSVALLAIGIGGLVMALKPFATMNWGQMIKMADGLIGLLVIIGAFTAVIQTLKIKGVMSVALLAAGIGLLILSILPLANMSWDQLIKMGDSLIALLAILAVFTKSAGSLKGSGLGKLILVAGSIWILMEAIKPLANYSWGQLTKMGVGLVALVEMLIHFTKQVAFIKGSGMANMVAIAAAIWILVQALQPLANYSWEQMAKMGVSLIAIAGTIIAVTKLIGTIDVKTGLSTLYILVGMAAAMLAFGLSMSMMKNVPWTTIVVACLGFIAVIASFILMQKYLVDMNVAKSASTLVLLAGLVVFMVGFSIALQGLKDISEKKILAFTAGVIAIVLGLATAMKIMKGTGFGKNIGSVLILLVGIAALMVEFSFALNRVKDIDSKKTLAFSTSLSVIILAIAGAVKLLKGVNIATGLQAILVLAAGLAALMGVMAILAPVLISSVADAVGRAIERLVSSLSLAAKMFAGFANDMDGVSEEQLASIKNKFMIMFDLVVSLKDADQYLGAISDFNACLLLLGSGIEHFITTTSGVTEPDEMNSMKLIQKFIDLKESLKNLDFGDAGTVIGGLGETLATFNTSTADITEEEPKALKLLNGFLNQADNIQTFCNLPIDDLKGKIAGLGAALSLYAAGAAEATGMEIDGDTDISGAVALIQKVGEAFSNGEVEFNLPEMPNNTELENFGISLATLALAIKRFAEASRDVGDTTMATGLIDFMMDLKSRLTKNALEVTKVFGEAKVGKSQLLDFGNDITYLGSSLKRFYEATKDFKKSQDVEDALDFFAGLKERLTVDNLLAVKAFGEAKVDTQVLTKFGGEIEVLGGALNTFAEKVDFDDKKKERFTEALSALDSLSVFANSLPVLGGVRGWFEGNVETVGKISDDVKLLGVALADMNDNLSGNEAFKNQFNYELVTNALDTVRAIVDIANVLSQTHLAVDGFQDVENLAVFIRMFSDQRYWDSLNNENLESGKTVLDYFAEMMVGFKDAMDKAGGFDNSSVSMFNAFKNMAEGISLLMKVDPELDFSIVGTGITDGIVLGLVNGQGEVWTTVENIVKTAIAKAKAAADENSPSKEFAWIGKFMSLGMAQGLNDYADDPINASEKMVNNVLSSAFGSMANLSALLAEDIDTNPTITPILDLSNVNAGAQLLNGMFGNQYGIGVNGGLSLDSSFSSGYATAANPTDYTSSMDSIKEEVGNMRIDLKTLSESMTKMKFVFNTGAVVAAIGPEMDEYLGRNGFYSERANFE